MSLSTYSGLQTALANLLNRQDLTAYIPDWITMCEAELNTRLTHRKMTQVATLSISGETYPLPCDFGGVESFRVDAASPYKLQYATMDAMDNMVPYYNAAPTHYAIAGDSFVFAPVPGGNYTARLRYRKLLPKLSENGENWLLSRYPNAYLYGSAIHSAPFLADDPRIATWRSEFANIVELINLESRRESEGSTMQTRSGYC